MRSGLIVLRLAAALSLVALLAVLPLGCSGGPKARLVDEGARYVRDDLAGLLADADVAAAEKISTDEVANVRKEVLVDLRLQGDDGSAVADLLTRGFPADTAAVPVIVELAEFEGKDSWVIIEVWGDESGTLDHRRIWVFDRETGALVASASKR